LTVQCHFIEVF